MPTQILKLPTRFLRLPEVKLRTGLSRSYIYRQITQGRFPKSIEIGARAVGWIDTEIDAWIDARIAASRPCSGGSD